MASDGAPSERRRESANILWGAVFAVVYGGGGALCAGEVLQAYLLKVGLTTWHIGLIGMVAGWASMAAMLTLIGVADRVERRVATVVWTSLLGCALPLGLLVLSVVGSGRVPGTAVFAVVLGLQVVLAVPASLRTMVSASLLVRSVSVSRWPRMSAYQGILGGLATAVLGYGAARVLERAGYPGGFTTCFALASILSVIGALALLRVSELPGLQAPARTGSRSPWAAVREIYRLREFRLLLAPNVMRGLLHAVPMFLFPVGRTRLGLSDEYAAYMMIVGSVAGIAGYGAIGLLMNRFRPGPMILAANGFTAVGLVGAVFADRPWEFLCSHGLATFGSSVMGTVVPLGVYGVAPKESVAAFDGVRLSILSLFGSLSMLGVGWALERWDARPLFVAAGFLIVVNGYLYYRAFRYAHQEPA